MCCRPETDKLKFKIYAPVHQSLNDGHLRLLELLLGVTASSVGKVDRMAELDVIGQRDVLDFDTR